ncbi:MAG TPA: hypothetical protein VKE70_08090, partial [Candidatus Solibacter sp.]|nr:hypothetical protein [Candidatus Solibacter sp.]
MIHVHRDPNPPALDVFNKATVPAAKGKKISRAASELQKAIEFFADPANYKNNVKLCKKKFPFKVYKDPELAKELEKLFHSKCAYCESHFTHATPKEIEHFRPKSEIRTTNRKDLAPGYFWLAGAWTNLLISCTDCNRERKHEVPGQPKTVLLGKHTQFPLRSEKARVRKHSRDVSSEEAHRLLLDPCTDDPEQHLTFDEQGLIHPRNGSDMGLTSIAVYALQRKPLVEERLGVLNGIIFQLEQLRIAVRELARAEKQ